MEIRAGAKLRSAVCSTEIVVVRPPNASVQLSCGGAPMLAAGDGGPGGAPAPGKDGGTLLGKRYTDEQTGLEVLCSKAGPGSLECDDRPLEIKGAKPLPASD